jgi:hypothetical protein
MMEANGIYRDRDGAATGSTASSAAGCQIHPTHNPATKNIAIKISDP